MIGRLVILVPSAIVVGLIAVTLAYLVAGEDM